MIKNKVKVNDFIKRVDLKTFQWDLKKQDNEESIRNLAKIIVKKWFSAPIFIWKDNYILDWHQRLKALNHLATQDEILKDDKVPVIHIEAETEKEAKETLLEYNTTYSNFDLWVLWEWSNDLDMEFLQISELWSTKEDEFDDDFDLPSWDKGDIETVTFTLHKDQNEQLQIALNLAKSMWEYVDTGNENANGNALARVVELFLLNNS